jgi:magnesium transporter
MIRILYRNELGEIETDLPVEQIADKLLESACLIWVDLSELPPATVEETLRNTFAFHPLAIDDALNETHVPKVDEWHDYLYVVLRAAELATGDQNQLLVPELDIFLGDNFLVTYSWEHIMALDRVWNHCEHDERWLVRGPDYLLYHLADELVTDMISVVEALHATLDEIEDQIFDQASSDILEELFTLKRNVLKLRRIAMPQRDVLQKLSRNKYEAIDKTERIYFRDVYDHLVRLNDLLEELLVLISSALDTYLSVVNNRMGNVMKTLTIITAFFMPLAFISGFFGMNFFQASSQFDVWTSRAAFAVTLAVMLLIPALMYWWMRRQTWI